MGITHPLTYGLKAFRRGCATDMVLEGKPLYEILQAGEWKSAAFRETNLLQISTAMGRQSASGVAGPPTGTFTP